MFNRNFDYRYMVYNTSKRQFQFPKICETTKQGAEKLFYNFIGKDSLKSRFEIRKVTKQQADRIKAATKLENKKQKLQMLLPELNLYEIEGLIKENERRGVEKCKRKETYFN